MNDFDYRKWTNGRMVDNNPKLVPYFYGCRSALLFLIVLAVPCLAACVMWVVLCGA